MILANLLKPALRYYIRQQSKKSLPNYNHSFQLAGLHKKVDIVRDQWAVPHIHAQNQEDLVFAQGFLHAQDRLWQMEMNRRIASGRIAEIFGKIALDADRISRTLGFKRLGAADWQRYQGTQLGKLLEAYCNGINAFIEQHPKKLPVEFKLLKIKPEPWTAIDSLCYGYFVSFRMSYGWSHELERMQLADKTGIQKAAELFPEYPKTHPEVLPKGIETYRILDGRYQAFQGPLLRPLGGSNNWSVAPQLNESGSAVLANDPHLAINMPNIWYENHLISPDLEVTGVSLLGAPLVLIGHNRRIAWGATLSFIDTQDCYIEDFTGESCLQYHHNGRILKATHLKETIYIKGQKNPHIETIVATHHGPVISDLIGQNQKKISLCSRALQENNMMEGFYQLNIAEGWNDFVNACEDIKAPSLNLNYADTDDNIGYYVTGQVPIRKSAPNDFPRQGWLSDYDWKGFIPFQEMPHALNPSKGYVFSCNHKIVDDQYPYELGKVWMNGYRAKRLEQLFQSKSTYHLEDYKNWQQDLYSIPGIAFRDLWKTTIVDNAKIQLPNELKEVSDAFLNWDGYLTKQSIGGCIYQVLKQQLIDLILLPELGQKETEHFRGSGPKPPLLFDNEFWGHDTTTLLRMLQHPENSKWMKKSSAETLIQAMQATVNYLSQQLGQQTASWQWGQLHQMTLMHVLGAKKPLDSIFNSEGIAIGGDTDTLCQIAFQPGEHYGGTLIAASYRQIIDMGNFSKSVCISPVGQSGNLLSPHRLDQFKLWEKGEYKPMVWTHEQIETHAKYRCSLQPA